MAATQQAVEVSFRGRVTLDFPLGDFKKPAVGKLPSGRVVLLPPLAGFWRCCVKRRPVIPMLFALWKPKSSTALVYSYAFGATRRIDFGEFVVIRLVAPSGRDRRRTNDNSHRGQRHPACPG